MKLFLLLLLQPTIIAFVKCVADLFKFREIRFQKGERGRVTRRNFASRRKKRRKELKDEEKERDKRFGLFTAYLYGRRGKFGGRISGGIIIRGGRYRGGKLAGARRPEERRPLSLSIAAQNILEYRSTGNNRARVIRNCGRRSRVASSAAGRIIHARTGHQFYRAGLVKPRSASICVCAPPSLSAVPILLSSSPRRNSPPLARIFALDSCPHIRCTAKLFGRVAK